MRAGRSIRVLVIDDSASNRRAISSMLEGAVGIEVIDRAADGEVGLKKALSLKPDCITLDLEMPRLDGYAFLRLLQARAPTPVIVLSSYGHPSDVFKALQLGAFDFVAKPVQSDRQGLAQVRAELVEKVRASQFARKPLLAREGPAFQTPQVLPRLPTPLPRPASTMDAQVPSIVAIGASTGGPPAVQSVLEALAGLPVCVLVAQHMPARFTEAFARRLDAVVQFRVREARDGDVVMAGRAYIAPGGAQLELDSRQGRWVTSVFPSQPTDLFAPSVDRLFSSVARHAKELARGVVLTGMGNDGAQGVRALLAVGAEVWVESAESAVVFGMPESALAAGQVTQVLPLSLLGRALAEAIHRSRGPVRSGA